MHQLTLRKWHGCSIDVLEDRYKEMYNEWVF